jgi:hypothetical protein
MRQTNWRVVIVGSVLVMAAAAFFFFMQTMASKSNDPVAMMRTVGQVAGAVGALGLVMLAYGWIGKRVP